MKLSILPIFVAFVFVFCLAITRRARSNESIKAPEARSVYLLLLTFFAWALIAVVLGIRGTHIELMPHLPLLWQSLVPVVLLSTRFHLLQNPPRRLARHRHDYTGALAGLFPGSPPWSPGWNHEGDPRGSRVQLRLLDQYT